MTIKPTFVSFLVGAAIISLAYIIGSAIVVHADASNVVPALIATTSSPTVTSTPSLVFATSSCVSRTIGTSGNGIMITFSDTQAKRPSATQGFWQAASTTVAYDASQFGCGAVYIYSSASQTITVQEGR